MQIATNLFHQHQQQHQPAGHYNRLPSFSMEQSLPGFTRRNTATFSANVEPFTPSAIMNFGGENNRLHHMNKNANGSFIGGNSNSMRKVHFPQNNTNNTSTFNNSRPAHGHSSFKSFAVNTNNTNNVVSEQQQNGVYKTFSRQLTDGRRGQHQHQRPVYAKQHTLSSNTNNKTSYRRNSAERQSKCCGVSDVASVKSKKSTVPYKYKTELCKSFLNGTPCKFGDSCKFAHGEHELVKAAPVAPEESGVLEGALDLALCSDSCSPKLMSHFSDGGVSPTSENSSAASTASASSVDTSSEHVSTCDNYVSGSIPEDLDEEASDLADSLVPSDLSDDDADWFASPGENVYSTFLDNLAKNTSLAEKLMSADKTTSTMRANQRRRLAVFTDICEECSDEEESEGEDTDGEVTLNFKGASSHADFDFFGASDRATFPAFDLNKKASGTSRGVSAGQNVVAKQKSNLQWDRVFQ